MSTSKKYKIRYDRIIAVAAIFIILIILIATALNKALSDKNEDDDSAKNNADQIFTEPTSTEDTTEPIETNPAKHEEYPNTEINNGNLILVNDTYEFNYESSAISIIDHKDDYFYVVDNAVSLNPDVIDKLNELTNAYFQINGTNDIRIINAYKEDSFDPKSELSTGLSFKIGLQLEAGTYSTFTSTGKYAWFSENCYKYGFIQRYPEDKTNITQKTADEAFFRYVGVPHAHYMKKNNLCLEEYLALVKNYEFVGEHLKIDVDDKAYEVYYVPKNTVSEFTQISIESNKSYEISGNNVDGFIVTVEV